MPSRNEPLVRDGASPLDRYLGWLRDQHAEEVEFAVLFGSRARGDALEDSDYDLLLGLVAEDGRRFTDRVGVFQDLITGKVQVFPYTLGEIATMEEDAHLLLLEALRDGKLLLDRGAWARLRARYERRVADGDWQPLARGWAVRE